MIECVLSVSELPGVPGDGDSTLLIERPECATGLPYGGLSGKPQIEH